MTHNNEPIKYSNMTDREKDIQALCSAVIYMPADWYDNPNGGYENTCPFCYTRVNSGDFKTMQLSELPHKPDCAYLIAKDLSTGF